MATSQLLQNFPFSSTQFNGAAGLAYNGAGRISFTIECPIILLLNHRFVL